MTKLLMNLHQGGSMQSLDDLPDGATVYIDTSIFVAHHSSHPVQGRPSTQFLKRIEAEGIRGVISALVVEALGQNYLRPPQKGGLTPLISFIFLHCKREFSVL